MLQDAKRIEKFVWIDLEMTGLDPQRDVILEIATIITEPTLEIIAYGPQLVIAQPAAVLATMVPEVRAMHEKHGLLDAVTTSSTSLEDAYRQTFDFIQQQCKKNEAVLCGNSIWQDRQFLAAYMPSIVSFLNYRLVDVSAIKVLINKWYPKNANGKFKKAETHRAFEDIKQSIAELQHYRTHFFVE